MFTKISKSLILVTNHLCNESPNWPLNHVNISTSIRNSELKFWAMNSQFEIRVNEALIELNGPSNPSIRTVEKKYDVSKSTFLRRLDGGVSRRILRSVQQLLTFEQEQSLITWILTFKSERHVSTYDTVCEMVSQIIRISDGPQTFNKRWIQYFFTRHSKLHSKIGKKIDH